MDMDKLRAETDMVAVIGSRVQLTRRGGEYVAQCPFHEDSTPSFCVVPDRGFFHCFGCSANGDAVAFVQRFDGIDFKAACAVVAGEPANPLSPRAGVKASAHEAEWRSEVPPTDQPRPSSMATRYHGEPVAEWCYRTSGGAVWGYAARYMVEGKKAILQWTYGRSPGEQTAHWACRHFSKPRPLYGLDGLHHVTRPVVVVEGEKAADAAKTLFPDACVVTWPGGVAAVKYADWTPLMGRECIVIPDADKPGHDAGQWIAEKLMALGCAVQVVVPAPDAPEGWDVADGLEAGWRTADAMRWLNANCRAYPFVEHPLATRPAPIDTAPSPFSEDALAQRFTAWHAADAKHVKAWGQWLLWKGHRWVRDGQSAVMEMIRVMLCDVVNSDLGKVIQESGRRKINSLHMVRAVETIASFSPTMATSVDHWDVDPWILSTPGGTIELKTGTLRPARREDFAMQCTTVTPSASPCPVWMQFLDTVMDHNPELIAYLQRLMGYALTGLTIEQHLSFFYGTGGNGKGVFLSTMRAILGDYAVTAPMSTFTESKLDRHPTDIAGLHGSRVVMAQETEEGRKWAESLIKSLTGGDPITARFMRQDFFEFIPRFKLIFAGNHKPALRSVDEAMRRRMHIVPWVITIPAEQRDHLLGEKLKAEYPAILQWMVEGCLAWQKLGLAPPDEVLNATDEYLDAEDNLSAWLDENCILEKVQSAPSKEVYQNYVAWCEDAKEFPMSHKRLVSNLSTRGCQTMKLAGTRSLVGIGLKVVEPVRSW